jgi:hypothetical protein
MKEQPAQCAHVPCVCVPPAGEEYCSPFCEEAGADEVEVGCDCGHAACSKKMAAAT